MFSGIFDVLILKIICKNKKIYYFDVFLNKKHLEPQLLTHLFVFTFKKFFLKNLNFLFFSLLQIDLF